ncbi:hypothetical protein ACIRCZ_03180 [Leifsonia sp. NPDC102414]|uniref:hypothetical protein n=1 Tax=Leifsonia sp. NPDC102414 TaxID=3364124 RepID=UPI003808AE7D
MSQINYTPKTKSVPASSIRPGHIVMESYQHPAVVTRISARGQSVHIWARYQWQASRDPEWLLGSFLTTDTVHKAVEKR